ncbi:MAG: NAD(P)/FAD-dependent oxidoreductase [Opitutaceae bacterium]|nr:NAD(P)/FAD-dependent oxidoreductase [Cytophagales bacterium]
MQPNIPDSSQKRVVIIGAGFAGLNIAEKLSGKEVQIVLIDKNNYHQFPPLFYQVATAGLEPSSISFPLRKVFQHKNNVHIRVAIVQNVSPLTNEVITDLGAIKYDFLVIATGTDTNFFGNKDIEKFAIPMKSVSEALFLRNRILSNFESALSCSTEEERLGLLNIVVAGGGPTGVEISGTLADMRRTVLPKDFPELDFKKMNIVLMEGSPKVLGSMSEQAAAKGKEYLEKLGVTVRLNTRVKDYDGQYVTLDNEERIRTNTLVWATGVKGNVLQGIDPAVIIKGRIKVDQYNKVESYSNIYAIGDVSTMSVEKFPNGHPQLAQVAIQQGKNLAKNILSTLNDKEIKPFKYLDLGSMATVGRNLAVVDLPFFKFQGFFAWVTWMFVHLFSLLGTKNKLFTFINWVWNYFTYDQYLRLIIKPRRNPSEIQ